ncbi:hypothetical protein [Arenimonas caeni]|jgi:hypothetical protein|uniref:hypothetical protein n=1 Tax=Arenimonas caeni TaxID=2058085 RepID=UPI002A36E4F0|nr:hypothetical protein [Arenimonas caeni]MDY0021448.1 hypothetical protein [Arenimonas caeni]
MPRFRPEAPAVEPVLSKLLWQALGLALLAVALPPLTFGQALLGPAASFWLPALPALALLTLHRRFLATAWRAHLVRATPRRRQRFAARAARPVSRARRAAYARAA